MLFNALRRGDLQTALISLALSLPAVVLCLSLHESAHGLAAYLLGDKTAHDSGRLSLSPFAHIDPIGFLCLLLFGFGWARPVPVNSSNFRKPKTGMALTALAGPLANFLTAFVAYCCYILIIVYTDSTFMQTVAQFLSVVAGMSVGLGVFNLIPIHPLDGSRILDAVLPFSLSLRLQRYRNVILLVFIAALYFGWLDGLMSMAGLLMQRLAIGFLSLFLG